MTTFFDIGLSVCHLSFMFAWTVRQWIFRLIYYPGLRVGIWEVTLVYTVYD